MKTRKITSGFVNFIIFSGIVALGAGSGYYTGNYRIGIHIGMALSLIGIMIFKLHQEKVQKALKYKEISDQH